MAKHWLSRYLDTYTDAELEVMGFAALSLYMCMFPQAYSTRSKPFSKKEYLRVAKRSSEELRRIYHPKPVTKRARRKRVKAYVINGQENSLKRIEEPCES